MHCRTNFPFFLSQNDNIRYKYVKMLKQKFGIFKNKNTVYLLSFSSIVEFLERCLVDLT